MTAADKPFSRAIAAVLRDADRKIRQTAFGDHHSLYSVWRVAMGAIAPVDCFYVGFFLDDQTVVIPYTFDGQEYIEPDVLTYARDGLSGWLQLHRRPYTYASDNGRLLHRGYSFGDERKISKDAIAAPLIDNDNVLGLVSIQSYRANVYDAEAIRALEWTSRSVITVLSRESEDAENRRLLGEEQFPENEEITSLTALVAEVSSKFGRLNSRIDALARTAAPSTPELARDILELGRFCQQLQVETAEILTRRTSSALQAVTALTPREREISHLIAEGLSNEQIADRLSISEPTVKTHVTRILRKFGVRQRSAVAARLRPPS